MIAISIVLSKQGNVKVIVQTLKVSSRKRGKPVSAQIFNFKLGRFRNKGKKMHSRHAANARVEFFYFITNNSITAYATL
jgi:hypothetical protein